MSGAWRKGVEQMGEAQGEGRKERAAKKSLDEEKSLDTRDDT